MRPFRILAIGVAALTLGLAAALIATGTPARAASSVRYVSLGDSYASGVGAGNESGSCDQSPNAFGPMWASANSPASFTFAACTGATTSSVISGQLSSLSASTTLVSIVIGGNDVGFSSIMETCVLESTSSCENAVAQSEQVANTTLPGSLGTLFADVKAHAPNAKVVVLDYPDFYDLSVPICIGLSSGDHQALDNGINDLDGVIQTAAGKAGFHFADVRAQFSGHELCDGSGWLHSLSIFDIHTSYHPTATGQADGYLPVFTAAAAAVGQ
ncbi:MAG TPA: SGNH/GDSL hydrolase family protein [Streptosporangiaceae bacterium]|nr:SGNH/GDSL hydrolase family protein [Streptosporangiaceae bacterium]